MPTYRITGTAYYADGFDFTIEALNETEARNLARVNVMSETEGYRFDPELQEVCIEVVETVKD